MNHVKPHPCELPRFVGVPPLIHPPWALQGLTNQMVVHPVWCEFNALGKDMDLVVPTHRIHQGHGIPLSPAGFGAEMTGQDRNF
jgi:hypothetical protein